MPFRSDDLVDDIMRAAPHTIRVFLEFKMAISFQLVIPGRATREPGI